MISKIGKINLIKIDSFRPAISLNFFNKYNMTISEFQFFDSRKIVNGVKSVYGGGEGAAGFETFSECARARKSKFYQNLNVHINYSNKIHRLLVHSLDYIYYWKAAKIYLKILD